MRWLITSLILSASLVGAALAQQAPQMTYSWDQQPDARAFAVNFPRGALRERVRGAATLCCHVTEDRRLDCAAPLEWPAGYGFGAASIVISREFRLSEASYAAISGDPSHVVRRTIRWEIPDVPLVPLPSEYTEAARTMCDQPAAPPS